MQQLHQQGGWGSNGWNGKDQNSSAMSSAYPPHFQGSNGDYSTNASSVDDLVSGAAREADDIDEIIRMAEAGIKPPKKGSSTPAPAASPALVQTPNLVVASQVYTPETTEAAEPKPEATEKTEKKSKKDKPVKMVYSDDEFSPEERMAKMPRYAFVPEAKTETVLEDANTVPGVAGTVDDA